VRACCRCDSLIVVSIGSGGMFGSIGSAVVRNSNGDVNGDDPSQLMF
jgi:hypothetical protein